MWHLRSDIYQQLSTTWRLRRIIVQCIVNETVKCTPPQIEDFTWSRHLFNLKGKIRKLSIKNTSIVLMYMIIYIKFCNKNLQCFFCSRYNLRKVNYIALFPSYILKNVKLYIQEHSLEPQILVRRLIYEMGRD